MVVEVFSVLMLKAGVIGICNRISIKGDSFVVSHLYYVNDTLIFCKPDLDELLNVQKILLCFQGSK